LKKSFAPSVPGISLRLLLAILAIGLPNIVMAQSATPAEAQALEQQGRLAEAAQVWRTITKQNPKDAGAFASLGVVLSKEEKYQEAASAYRRALALNPKLPGVQLNLGLAEFKQGRFESAIGPLKAALSDDPSSTQAQTLLGISYYGAKQFSPAVKYLEVAAKADPDNAELHHMLAQSCLSAKQYQCAVEEFRQILQKDPDSAPAHILTGEALDGLGKTAEAIAEFQTAAKVSPREPNVYFGLGYLYWKSNQYDDAEREFRNQLSVDRGNAQAMAYLGDIELKRSNPDKALEYLRQATQSRKDIRIAYLNLGAVLTEKKQYKDALAALQHAVELDPAQPDAHYRLGRVYQGMGNSLAAEAEFKKVKQLHQKADEDIASKMAVEAGRKSRD
jgi:tetratricopeptide (TPR) repeat protein